MSSNTLENLWDPESFRQLGHELVDALADHLAAARLTEVPAYPGLSPEAMMSRWPDHFPVNGSPQLSSLVSSYLTGSTQLHSPRYIGHQVAAPAPLLAFAHLVSALINQSSAVFEMSPSATVMEKHVVSWMARQLGYGPEADGMIVSGGALGNLTCLLAARARARERWPGARPAILVSEQSHYCVARAAEILGLEPEAVISVPADASFRMDVQQLDHNIRSTRDRGLAVMAVAASACSTATGSYDPVEATAELCERHGLWLHVDGAHGASAVLSSRYRALTAGIERADSVVWDIHKMMMAPALATGIFFRAGSAAFADLSQKAAYLLDERVARYDGAQRTIECTRPALALPIYLALQALGTEVFGEYVTAMYDRARRFAQMLEATPGFELAVAPESNILCFRYAPRADHDRNNELQRKIRERLLSQGDFYIVQTELRGLVYLRTALMNPFTSEEVLQELIDRIRQVADELL